MSSSLSLFTLNVQIHDVLFRIILDPFFNVLISFIGLLLSGWFISSLFGLVGIQLQFDTLDRDF